MKLIKKNISDKIDAFEPFSFAFERSKLGRNTRIIYNTIVGIMTPIKSDIVNITIKNKIHHEYYMS